MTKQRTKIIILGATGFIGKALVRRCGQESSFSITSFNSSSLNLLTEDAPRRLAEVAGDSTLVVLSRSYATKNDRAALAENILIATNVARVFESSRIKKCVYFSSTSVYENDETNLEIKEDGYFLPSSLYGIAKLASEKLLEKEAERHQTPLLVVRPCMIYGPEDRWLAYGPMRFIRQALDKTPVNLFGDGGELRDYLYIDDLAEIVFEFIRGDQTGVFNIASGEACSFVEMLKLIEKITSTRLQIKRQERDRPKASRTVSIEKLKAALPHLRFTPLKEGLQKTVGALKAAQRVSSPNKS